MESTIDHSTDIRMAKPLELGARAGICVMEDEDLNWVKVVAVCPDASRYILEIEKGS